MIVTGGSGLVGQAIRRLGNQCLNSLESPDSEFVFWSSRDCDLRDADRTLRAMEAIGPAAVVHLAATSGGVGLTRAHPATVLRDNLRMSLNVLEASRTLGASKTVMCLSSGMYPANAPLPLSETSLHHGDPHPSNYSYAFAKRMVEPMIRAWRDEFGIAVVGLSPNGIIGEHDCFHGDHANLTGALIGRLYEQRSSSQPIVIWGDGTPLRELSYAGDIARDFLWALDHYDAAEVLNIGTTEEVSVRDVAFAVADELGIARSRLRFDPSRPGGVPRKSTDSSRYRALSGARYTPFRDALRRTIAWYVETRRRDPQRIRMGPKALAPDGSARGRAAVPAR